MAVRIESQAEPLPGYRLIERLGGGGFGEVWKCEAPGGLHKAIKFVFGDLQATDNDGARAEQELKALSRVKTVHHPYILSLERYDIIDGQLIIVMELADRTLWDRYRECKEEGLPGVPRDELLGYMAETAEALDLMNSLYQLQHLDIKPQNIFLVHNHVKVADFGLVKDLEGMMASVTGGVTPVYAAPETFDGWVSRFSDQYSLAIVYQEVLTGQRPFTGTSIRQLVLQHLQATPDLSSLSPSDRQVITKALSKKPEDRYATCAEMIQALRDAAAQPVVTGPAPDLPEPPRETMIRPVTIEAEIADQEDEAKTHSGPRRRNPRSGTRAVPAPPAPPQAVTPGPPVGQPTPGPAKNGTHRSATVNDNAPKRAAPVEIKGDGVLRPALVIGLGKQGLAILKRLRQEILEQFGTHDALPHVRLLYLDTDPEAVQLATGGNPQSALRSAEVLLTRLHRPSHYLKPGLDGEPRLVSWLNPKLLYRMPRQQTSAGLRALGRLAFVDNFRTVSRRLQSELEACSATETLDLAARRTGLGIHSSTPRVYLATSLAGGTGSGMFLDVAYTMRHLLKQLGCGQADIVGLFLLPEVDRTTAPTLGVANTFTALTELNHFAAPNAIFQARYEMTDQKTPITITEVGAPFQRCVLLPLPERRGRGDLLGGHGSGVADAEATSSGPSGLAGRLLVTELATPLGLAAEKARGGTPTGPIYQTFGMYRLLWPRRHLLQQTSRELCKRLVQRWMNKDAKPLRDSIQPWAEAQWHEQGLSADQLILRLQEECERVFAQSPEQQFQAILAAALPAAAEGSNGKTSAEGFQLSTVMEALEQLERLVGIPGDCRPTGPTLSDHPISSVEDAVCQAATKAATVCEQRLAELLVRLIEEPAFRLAGAEEAVRQFNAAVEKALQHQEHLAKELQARAAALYQRIHTLLGIAGQASTSGKTPFNRRAASEQNAVINELSTLLRSYPKTRYQSLVLSQLNGLYVSLRGLLSEQMREIGFCRQRLSELADLFSEAQATVDLQPAAGHCLFAGGSDNLRAAVAQLVATVNGADMQDLDQRVQAMIRKQFRALVHVCTASSTVIRNVAPAMQEETEAFLADRQAGMNVTDMYLTQQAGTKTGEAADAAIQQDLARTYDLADAELDVKSGRQFCVLAVPPGPEEQDFREVVRRALPEVSLTAAPGSDEILFYREQVGFNLTDLKQLGTLGQEAYQQMTRREQFSAHSRIDITDWRAVPVTVS
jgi:eukaryotic-like serine/threonine-protein kinase